MLTEDAQSQRRKHRLVVAKVAPQRLDSRHTDLLLLHALIVERPFRVVLKRTLLCDVGVASGHGVVAFDVARALSPERFLNSRHCGCFFSSKWGS